MSEGGSGADRRPMVAVVFALWNGKEKATRCLESVARLDYPLDRLEVVVADNASTNDAADVVERKLEELVDRGVGSARLIRLPDNRGVSGGYNACIEALSPEVEFVWKIDYDIEIDPDALNLQLLPFAEPDVAITCPHVIDQPTDPDSTETVSLELPRYDGWRQRPYWVHADSPTECEWATGHGTLIRAAVFREYDLRFNEKYFYSWEDIAFAFDVRALGFRIIYQPAAVVRHFPAPGQNLLRTYYSTRNRLAFAREHGSVPQRAVFFAAFFVYVLPRVLLSHLKAGQREQIGAALAGSRDFILGRMGRTDFNRA